jgi:hypothetical protein
MNPLALAFTSPLIEDEPYLMGWNAATKQIKAERRSVFLAVFRNDGHIPVPTTMSDIQDVEDFATGFRDCLSLVDKQRTSCN